MAKVSNKQNIGEKEKKPKVVMLDEYFNFMTFKKDFITNTMMERLAQELVEWASTNDDAIKIKQFCALKGISEKKWHDWYTRYDVLREAHDHAKTIIGNRREAGAMTRKYADGPTTFMLPMYDSDWGEMMERRAKLASKDDDSGGTKVVVMEKYAEVAEVPRRKGDE